MLDNLIRGRRVAAVRYHYGENKSTVCFMKKNENKIREE
jgi:hypothetical protein